ncbi:hypothetical protein DRW42_02645 [Pedobacter miscanthi]|uniref:Uncharacterized protein n=1 Tax=Pedobacter miscanthi TaxID=2259170 RepID=A0A366LC74_9SPHI|nr:hypothetical protein DRW42_02645 [Pedobacter miscanthi]
MICVSDLFKSAGKKIRVYLCASVVKKPLLNTQAIKIPKPIFFLLVFQIKSVFNHFLRLY